MQNLFLEPEIVFEKIAAEASLPEDANTWPNEILQELFKQVPYISDFDPHVVMDRVDAEKGFGFGHVEVGNKTAMLPSTDPQAQQTAGVHKVRIPIIIRMQKLQPFDILVTEDSKMLPLTESRLRQALFRPQAFDITSQTPGDHSMIGQLYPPYRQNYGFGGGGVTMSAGMGKDASARSLLATVLPSASGSTIEKVAMHIAEDDNLQALYLSNRWATAGALSLLASAPTDLTAKTASILPGLIRPTVVQLLKGDGDYIVKAANHNMWAPTTEHINRGEAVQRFGSKVVLAADLNGGVTVAEGADAAEAPESIGTPELVKEFGIYKVHDVEGNELIGFVFPNLLDLDGTVLPLALFTNGSQAAVQGEILGTKAGDADIVSLPTGHPRGYGAFYRMSQQGPEATIPFELHGSISQGGEVTMQGTSFDGHPVQVAFNQPNLDKITFAEGTVLVPEDFQWLPLVKEQEVALASKPEEAVSKEAACRPFASVTVRGDAGSFSFDGLPVDKLAADQRRFLSPADAFFLLGGLGVEMKYGRDKLAEAMHWGHPVEIRVGRYLKTAGEVRQEMLKSATRKVPATWCVDLVKEAAVIPDPVAVDTVLSLGFLNDENLTHFISYLPIIDQAQERMCELLVSARLGMREIPAGALERAIRSVEEVLEGLKVLAFQQN